MKQHTLSILFLTGILLAGGLASCTDDLPVNQPAVATVDDTNLVETHLLLNVAVMDASSIATTRAGDDNEDPNRSAMGEEELRGTDAERRIDNIWVFQFNPSGQLLITPRYYDISGLNASPDETEGVEVSVLLKPDVESIVYVVANTGSSTWATVSNSPTLDSLQNRTLPRPDYIAVNVGGDLAIESRRIPMEGALTGVTLKDGDPVNVKVTRMFAKLEIMIENIPETLDITDVEVGNIPFYCRVNSLDLDDENDSQRGDYPDGTEWITHAFKPGKKDADGKYTGMMVIYIPENLQGRINYGNPNDPGLKTQYAFKEALYLNFKANYKDLFTGDVKESGRSYLFYPGANNWNDYNVKRNNIYRATLNVYSDLYEQDIASSNCFVVKPNQLLSFLPYYRTETGGGYKFTDYLDANGNDASKKINNSKTMTDNIRIIWQTKDAIGDNSKGDRVWVDSLAGVTDEYHRKIYVRTGTKSGNALIAAYNSDGDIIWSWHIWVTEGEPANLGSAITYSTYAWNERQIYTDIRVPGYAIMSCNLGALKDEPNDVYTLDPETHGMLYQWGRKDPFPPANTKEANDSDYSDAFTGKHYGNDNTTIVGKTAGTDTDQLFHSLAGKDNNFGTNEATLKFTIQNPTVFICGTKEAKQTYKGDGGEDYIKNSSSYIYDGDWLPGHDNKLWGGLDPDDSGDMKKYNIRASTAAHIYDNYGAQKSIFDPCPSGWRVPPGDLWIGFTKTGENPNSYDQINTATEMRYSTDHNGAGMYMYMTDWRQGVTSFFPTQGTRIPDGTILRTSSCGNYHNATTDINNRVNILHIHKDPTLFRVFELGYRFYYVKSTGGPVRCVRDHK